MMVTAILLRPWTAQMKERQVYPRILADDLQVMAIGEDHLEDYVGAVDAIHKHLQDLGAKISPSKCISFSAADVARRWLREHR